MTKEFVAIGKILTTHGLIGNIKLESFCENPEEIFSYNLYTNNGNKISCRKVGKTSKNNIFIAKIDGVNSIDEAMELKNNEIFVKREELQETEEDEVYIDDLLNMKVNGDGKTGSIIDVYNYGAGDVIEIKWDDNKIESVPFTKDFIKDVDKENNIIYINLQKYI